MRQTVSTPVIFDWHSHLNITRNNSIILSAELPLYTLKLKYGLPTIPFVIKANETAFSGVIMIKNYFSLIEVIRLHNKNYQISHPK